MLLKSALIGLRANKLRSLLTTLGIIIGVATVISMISIIEGMNQYTYKVLGAIGSNTIYVQKWEWRIQMGRMTRKELRELMKRPDLTVEDAKAISQLPSVKQAVPYMSIWQGIQVSYGNTSFEVGNLDGVEPGYIGITGHSVEEGRELLEEDIIYRRQVCVIGSYIAQKLFEDANPIGKEIRIGNHTFMVVGVLKKRGTFLGNNLDDIIIIPLSTHRKFYVPRGTYRVFSSLGIVVEAKPGRIEDAIKEIEELMRSRRGLRFDQENNFGVNTQQILVEAYKKLTSGIFMAMIFIASLALLVGGIGIMNIMLVSVRERTREIGLRMAVGAKRMEIMIQFLFEAVVLTATGGIVGTLIGFLIAKIVDILTPLPSGIPLWSIALGVGFSAGVGLFFGIHPASVAARMDPIEALRYE